MPNNYDFSKLPVIAYVMFGLFLLFSGINLFFAFKENEKWRKITKPFTIIPLIVLVVCWMPNRPLILIALLLDLAGDILLIWKKKMRMFLAGGICFIVGHILYVVQALLIYGDRLGWQFYAVWAFSFVIFNLGVFGTMKKIAKNGTLGFLIGGYLSFVLMLPVVFGAGLFVGYENFLLLAFLGSIAFVASDALIMAAKFVVKIKRPDFFIMALYLIAQALIIAGFGMTLTSLIWP